MNDTSIFNTSSAPDLVAVALTVPPPFASLPRSKRGIGWVGTWTLPKPRTPTRPRTSHLNILARYRTILADIMSCKMFCALALVTIAHSESLLRGSPHTASYSFDQTNADLEIGHLRLKGSSVNWWCYFNSSHLTLPFSALAQDSPRLSFHCFNGSCVNLLSATSLSARLTHALVALPVAHTHIFMKLQHYSITFNNSSLVRDQTNMYLAWIFHTAQSVTDRSCLVCHDRSSSPHLMFPMGDLAECLAQPYTEEFLCLTICLLAPSQLIMAPSGCVM